MRISRHTQEQPEPGFRIAKIDEDERLVFGWASIAKDATGAYVVDGEGEIIDPVDLEPAVYDYVLDFGDMTLSHEDESVVVGKLVESLMLTKEKAKAMGIQGDTVEGWWAGFFIEDQEVFDLVKAGEVGMFSIGGMAQREEIEI